MTCGARMSDGRSADGRTARAPILRGGEGVKVHLTNYLTHTLVGVATSCE